MLEGRAGGELHLALSLNMKKEELQGLEQGRADSEKRRKKKWDLEGRSSGENARNTKF